VTSIRWSPQAADDLAAVRDFIARDSDHYAKLVASRIVAAIDALATSPKMGRVVPELPKRDVRELIVGAYRVVYRYRREHDLVEIVTIVHGARLFRGNSG
jgi:plasmid stabilization system protein ParE